MRYGPKRIAAVLGIIAMITLTSFAVKNYFNKQNAAVLGTIHTQALKLADNEKVSLAPKSQLVVEELKLGQTTLPEVINAISDSLQKINISSGIATQLVFQGRGQPAEIVHEALRISDSLLEIFPFTSNDPAKLSAVLKEMNDLRSTLELEYSYQPSPEIAQWRIKNARRNARWVSKIIEQQPAGYKDMQELGIAMENAINYKALSKEEITKILSILSPFENASRNEWLQSNFQQDKIMDRGELGYGFFFNGLYQELAYLYAANGNSEKVLRCIDSLSAYSQNNYQGEYAEGADNATNIAAVYYSNGMEEHLDEFVKGYCTRKNIPEEEFYAHLLGRTARERATAASLNLLWWMDAKMNLNLRYSSRGQLAFFYDKYRKTVEATIADPDQRNLLTALSYKNEGILISMGRQQADTATKGYFDLALNWYKKVNPSYLAQTQTIIGISGSDQMVVPRKTLFIYPDFRVAFHPMEQRSFYHFYTSDLFMEYILKNQLFDIFYPGADELKNISSWLGDYNVRMFVPQAFLVFRMRYSILQQLDAVLEKRKAEHIQDFNLLYLNLGQMAQAAGEKDKMLAYYRKLVPNNLLNNLRTKEYDNNVNNNAFKLMAYAVKGFVQAGHMDEAHAIVSIFKKPTNRSSLYAFAAAEMQLEKGEQKLADELIDSSRIELNRTQNVKGWQPNRQVLAYALALQNPEKNKDEIYKLIKNLPQKMDAIRENARAKSFHQYLYDAYSTIPGLISDDDIAGSLWQLLYSYNLGENNHIGDQWNLYQSYYVGLIVRSINYEDESN